MKRILAASSVLLALAAPALASAATLSVTPSSQTVQVGDTVSVDIVLDTQGAAIDGVDLSYLSYDPSRLALTDADATAPGVQITPGSLMGTTAINSADTTAGLVSFSQVVAGGTKYTGSGVLAHATFQALGAGSVSLALSFAAGSTTDSNVASGGTDALSSVSNATITISAPPPASGGSGGGGGGSAPAVSGGGGSGGGAISSGTSGGGASVPPSGSTGSPSASSSSSSPAASTVVLARSLARGSIGADVSMLQAFLVALGYLPADDQTGFFGAATESAVQQYQCAKGIVCAGSPSGTGYGAVGTRTRAALSGGAQASSAPSASSATLTKRLALGMTDAQVLDLQRALNSSADTRIASSGPGSPGQETQYFGTLTMLALERFQAKYGIASSGTPSTTGYGAVGPLTRATLNGVLSGLPQ